MQQQYIHLGSKCEALQIQVKENANMAVDGLIFYLCASHTFLLFPTSFQKSS